MLTIQEKQKVLDILSEGLGIRNDIILARYLDRIHSTSEAVKKIESKLDDIERKLDRIIRSL